MESGSFVAGLGAWRFISLVKPQYPRVFHRRNPGFWRPPVVIQFGGSPGPGSLRGRSAVMRYTIMVPFFNEQDNVTEMYARIKAAVEAIPDDFEFVFVDDGSTDRTFDILEQIAAVDSRVTVVKLSRNYGKTDALVAGFEQSAGDYIITLDGDLRHDPSDIPLFLEKIDE